MSLSDEERQTLVHMELQKAHDAYEDHKGHRESDK